MYMKCLVTRFREVKDVLYSILGPDLVQFISLSRINHTGLRICYMIQQDITKCTQYTHENLKSYLSEAFVPCTLKGKPLKKVS